MTKPVEILCFLVMVLAAGVSCSRDSSAPDRQNASDYTDPSITQFNNLGFLGAAGHGATKSITVPDPQNPGGFVYPGGVVLRVIEPGSLLSACGLQSGDVVIRVMDDYLPNKEDPTLDLLNRLESAYTAGKTKIPVEYLRAGKLEESVLNLEQEKLPPLGGGDFLRSDRFVFAAQKGLEYLKCVQKPDGSFPVHNPTPDAVLSVVSMAGLAFLGALALPEAPDCGEALDLCLEYVEGALNREDTGFSGGAFATLFIAEYLQDGKDLARLAVLAKAVQKLLPGQEESGGWSLTADEQEVGYNESTLAAHFSLQALGAAERAGVQMDNAPFEKACQYMKAQTSDGEVGYKPMEGFDRRSEAGRLAGVLAAMRSISCDFNDPYMQKLFRYYSGYTAEIARAPVDESIHLFSAAILSRQKGLPQWSLFVQENQVLVLGLQKPDGSFTPLPKANRKAIPFFDDLDGPAWRTAVYTIILLLQEDALPLLVSKAPEGWERRRDSDGKITSGDSTAPSMEGPQSGPVKTMQFSSVEEAIEFMKKMGMDENDPQIQKLKKLEKNK